MTIILNVLTIILRVVAFPIFYVIDIFSVIIDKKKKGIIKFFIIVAESFLLTCWGVALASILDTPPLELMMQVISPVCILVETNTVDYDPPSHSSGNASYSGSDGGIGTGSVNFNGKSYNIDFSQLNDSTTVSLPSGTYTTGTVLQRAEALAILNEICARPEITVTPAQICSLLYAENKVSNFFPDSGSIVKNLCKSNRNGATATGPFQIIDSSWSGHSYISKLENPNLNDSERVDNPNAKTIQGEPRPSRVIFSDAAYSAALLLQGKINVEPRVKTWLASNSGLNANVQSDILAMYGYMNYSSGHKECCAGFMIPLLCDTYKKSGTLNILKGTIPSGSYHPQWTYLTGSNCDAKNFPLANDGSGYINSLGSPTYTSAPTCSLTGTYASMWTNNHGYGSGHKLSHCYCFIAYSGGQHIYDGLCALATQLPQASTSSDTDVQNVTINKSNYKVIDGYMHPLPSGIMYITCMYGTPRPGESKGYHIGSDLKVKINGAYGNNNRYPNGNVGYPVLATKSGTVVFGGIGNYSKSAGNWVVLKHDEYDKTRDIGYSTYMHFDSCAVKNGDHVTQGQVIGYLGNTGQSQGAHLHFQLGSTAYNNDKSSHFMLQGVEEHG